MSKLGIAYVLAVGAMQAAVASPASAADYDNPDRDGVGCVAIAAFATERDGKTHKAETVLENVCSMAMEVEFCLTKVGEETRLMCDEVNLRPNESLSLKRSTNTGRLLGPSVSWRMLTLGN